MELLAELSATHKREKALRLLNSLVGIFDGFNIPDSPLGYPSTSSLAFGAFVRSKIEEGRVIINQRLSDINEISLISIARGAKLWDLELLLTRGDKPVIGREVGYLTSEEALNLIKRNVDLRVGLIVSMRKKREEILERLKLNADFFFALRVKSTIDLEGLRKDKLYVYVIVENEKNKEVLRSINQPSVKYEEVGKFIKDLEGQDVKGVIISCPSDHECLGKIKLI